MTPANLLYIWKLKNTRSPEKLHQRRTATQPFFDILDDDQHIKALCDISWCFSQL